MENCNGIMDFDSLMEENQTFEEYLKGAWEDFQLHVDIVIRKGKLDKKNRNIFESAVFDIGVAYENAMQKALMFESLLSPPKPEDFGYTDGDLFLGEPGGWPGRVQIDNYTRAVKLHELVYKYYKNK